MLPTETVTAHEPTSSVFADEFHRDETYTNRRPYGSGDWLLIHTVQGAGRFITPTGSFETGPGEVVLYHPQDPQDYATARTPGTWHLLWAHFAERAQWHHLLHWPRHPSGIRCLKLAGGETSEKFQSALHSVIHFSPRPFAGAAELAANALEAALIWAHISQSHDPRLNVDPRIRRAIEHIESHQKDPFSLKELARHSGLSLSRFAFLFKKETGFSPRQFRERGNLQRAAQLLRLTNLTVGEIAYEVGFSDPFYFSNRFRRFSGNTPSGFRIQPGEVPPHR